MKLSLFRPSAALTLLFLSGDAIAADSGTCVHLTDAESPFRTSLGSFFRLQAALANEDEQELDFAPYESAFASLDTLAPWLSTCVANVDVSTIAVKLLSSASVAQCAAQLETIEMPDTELSNELFADYVCPLYKNTLVPCVNDVLLKELLVPAIDGAVNDCCYDLKAMILSSFGSDLATMVSSLTKLVGNAVCSTKTFTNTQGELVSQRCGFSFIAALGNSATEESNGITGPLLTTMQVPNDQVCAAVTGQNFMLTSGETALFPASATDGSTYGVCFQAMSDLVNHVSAYPVLEKLTVSTPDDTVIKMSDIFEDKTCVSAAGLVSGLMDENGFVMKTIAVANDLLNFDGPSTDGSEDDGESSDDDGESGDDDDDGESGDDDDDDSSASADWSGKGDDDLSPALKTKSHARALREAATWLISVESDGSEASLSSSSNGEDGEGSESDHNGGWSPLPAVNATTAMLNSTAEYIDEMETKLCLHIPHGVVCDYGSETIAYAYPEVASSSPAGPGAGVAGASASTTFHRRHAGKAKAVLHATAKRLRHHHRHQ